MGWGFASAQAAPPPFAANSKVRFGCGSKICAVPEPQKNVLDDAVDQAQRSASRYVAISKKAQVCVNRNTGSEFGGWHCGCGGCTRFQSRLQTSLLLHLQLSRPSRSRPRSRQSPKSLRNWAHASWDILRSKDRQRASKDRQRARAAVAVRT